MSRRPTSADESPFRNRSAMSLRTDGESPARIAPGPSLHAYEVEIKAGVEKGGMSGSCWNVSGQTVSSVGSNFPGIPPVGAGRATRSSKYLPWRTRHALAASDVPVSRSSYRIPSQVTPIVGRPPIWNALIDEQIANFKSAFKVWGFRSVAAAGPAQPILRGVPGNGRTWRRRRGWTHVVHRTLSRVVWMRPASRCDNKSQCSPASIPWSPNGSPRVSAIPPSRRSAGGPKSGRGATC